MDPTTKYLLHRIEALENKIKSQEEHIDELNTLIKLYDKNIVDRLIEDKEKVKTKYN